MHRWTKSRDCNNKLNPETVKIRKKVIVGINFLFAVYDYMDEYIQFFFFFFVLTEANSNNDDSYHAGYAVCHR